MATRGKAWQTSIEELCDYYNIPLKYLPNTLSDPKVIPMVRGKAFENSAMEILDKILSNEWEVDKPVQNPQLGLADMDVRVKHKETGIIINIECKLSAFESFRKIFNRKKEIVGYFIRIKCMRSRTLGVKKAKDLAPIWGVSSKVISVHSDSYRTDLADSFDFVVTSLGNVFFRTNPKTLLPEWNPTKDEIDFLKKLSGIDKYDATVFKDWAFNKLYIAKATELIPGVNDVRCNRRNCKRKDDCGFIPNYPYIKFDENLELTNGWSSIQNSEKMFFDFISIKSKVSKSIVKEKEVVFGSATKDETIEDLFNSH